MPDNTITNPTNTLTPAQLREALDQWCEDQPGVILWHPKLDCWYANNCFYQEGNSPLTPVVGKNGRLFKKESFYVLLALAIEHHYIPWLRLAASLPYTGAKAARVALKPKSLGSVLGQVQQDLGSRVDIAGVEVGYE